MKRTVRYFLIIVLTFANCLAQNSIHLRDKLSHPKNRFDETTKNNFQKYRNITIGTNLINKTIFGFLPYWEISSANIRLNLLSHIALFDFVLNADQTIGKEGSLTPPYNWPNSWFEIINQAKENNVKVLVTISNLTDEAVDSILVSNLINNQIVKEVFFEDVHSLIADYNLDGVILDFENLKLNERGDPINNFVQELRDSLDAWFTGKELSFATPAVNWGSRWKLKELSEICDYLFVMAYDYHGSWSTNAGPVAPLIGNGQYNLWNYQTTIEIDYAEVIPSKLILGVPYYGARWKIDNLNPYTEVVPFGESNSNWINNIDYEDISWGVTENYFVFDIISQSPYLIMQNGEIDTLTWIDNVQSLSLKYDFALEENLRGVGFWSIGKDGNHPELWNLIEEKFADSTTSVEEEKLANEFILYQNYPNPFNPSTKIKYQVLGYGNVILKVYDVLGNEVAVLVDEEKSHGIYEVEFDADNLSSGIYFYRITVYSNRLNNGNKFMDSKKMILLK